MEPMRARLRWRPFESFLLTSAVRSNLDNKGPKIIILREIAAFELPSRNQPRMEENAVPADAVLTFDVSCRNKVASVVIGGDDTVCNPH